MHHLYLDNLSCTNGERKFITEPGGAVSLESVPRCNSLIYHTCGKEEHKKSGCVLPGKTYDNRTNGHLGKIRKT